MRECVRVCGESVNGSSLGSRFSLTADVKVWREQVRATSQTRRGSRSCALKHEDVCLREERMDQQKVCRGTFTVTACGHTERYRRLQRGSPLLK